MPTALSPREARGHGQLSDIVNTGHPPGPESRVEGNVDEHTEGIFPEEEEGHREDWRSGQWPDYNEVVGLNQGLSFFFF